LLENRVSIFRFQLLAVYVLLVHNCGECRINKTFHAILALFFYLFLFSQAPSLAAFGYSGISQFKN
jgi:hypothetical protein